MQAITIKHYGGPENLVIGEHPDPRPQPGHVIIEVKAFGINRAEIYFREGAWGDVAPISGIECVGRVLHDPDGVLATGQRVMALMGGMGRSINGSYAEQVSVPSANVIAVNTDLPWAELAAIPETYATAWTCLHRNLGIRSGQTVLIRGATSALGQAAVNIAVEAGVTTLATTRQQDRFATLAQLGAEPVLDTPDLSAAIRQRRQSGLDGVFEIVGNSTLVDSLAMVRADGRVCMAGFLGGDEPINEFNPLMQMPSGVHLSFFASAFSFGNSDYPLSGIPFQTIIQRVQAGVYQATPARVFEFRDIVAAHQFMESNQANGKIVVQL
jgi:NADPH:quinone reductase-like Zn-dependent oxidoreductase